MNGDRRAIWFRRARRALLWTGGVLLGLAALGGLWLLIIVARVPSVKGVPAEGPLPAPTAYMARAACGDDLDWRYEPIGAISPALACGVIAAEDHRLYHHAGVDWRALRAATWDTLRRGHTRAGASTIAMQLARNLVLSPNRTLRRKVEEIVLARRLVARLGRRRVLELYLNVAEWAPCRYGAEAAAQALFGRGAGDLDLFEATLLASILPRPRTPLVPDDAREVARRQGILMRTFRDSRLISWDVAHDALGDLDRTWHVLVKTGDAEGLLSALRARSAARPPLDPAFGAGWLEVRCGLP